MCAGTSNRLSLFGRFEDFAGVIDPARYTAAPDDWIVGLTDVVRSTAAIEAGRYKAVNVAGSAAISALMNALDTSQFAFSFSGDGCAFLLPPGDEKAARRALAATAAWARDDLRLELRAALVPVRELRAAGVDVSVALYSPSPHVAYAMFDGGGLALAERAMKAGRYAVPPAPTGERPDLSGLSCRWRAMRASHGAVVSVIVVPGERSAADFRGALSRVIALLADARTHPVPEVGPPPALMSPGTWLEAAASRGARSRAWQAARVAAHNLMGFVLFRTGARVGRFDASRYRALASQNADARKFGDGLQLTADCDAELERALMRLLETEAASGTLAYGLHRQDAALMTCIVPSYEDDGHYHFVDGAGGGYAKAAADLKRRMTSGAR